jgi:hypothetical protein
MRLFSALTISIFGFCLLAITLGVLGCRPITDEADEPGKIIIGLTDTEGDFVRYMVEVLSLSLTKADGSVVETLPLSTKVDFAQYTEMTEFLTAASIPSGFYIKATLTLDYENADIWIENDIGEAERIHTILDVDGNAITTLEASVHLEDSSSLLIAPGIPAHLTLDFNLDASNKIDDNDPNILIVQPLLLADVNLKKPKLHRLRGPLKEVNVSQGNFLVIIRPFIHFISGGDERFGVLRVTTNSDTVYAINGNLYQGQEGLNELNKLNIMSPTIVIWDPKPNSHQFEAHEVRAGYNVPGGTLDVVTGNVTSRDLNSLTVKGATLIRTNSSVVFNDTVTIYLDATGVGRQFSTDIHNTADISVGQRITVFGTIRPDTMDRGLNADFVHLQLTTLRGTVNRVVDDKQIDVNLKSIDGRRINIFDFQGTGIDTGNDADPNDYEIDTNNLVIPSLHTGSPVKVFGFVNAFGQAPEDFKAQKVVDVSGIPALMNVSWFPANPNAFENLSTEGITLSLDDVGLFHHIGRAGVVINLNVSPTIQPDSSKGGAGLFSISQDWTRHLHFSFENFVTDLEGRLMENASVKHLTAIGPFNDVNATLTASHINVLLVE